MKYLVILVLVVVLVRIDVFLRLFDKMGEKLTGRQPETQSTEVTPPRATISLTEDQTLKQSPRQIFLGLLENFRSDPLKSNREQALNYFKAHPTIFTQKLDTELEATIYRWRELMVNNEPEVGVFLNDLLNILQGENQLMVKRFFSIWMDINMENFLAAYSKTKDTNCTIATVFGDSIPEEEKLNEYRDREDALKTFVMKEGANPSYKALANNCLMVLNIEISKYNPTLPETSEPEPAPETIP